MHLIFLGAPGAGKGTQAHLIAERFEAAHVSTGDILRQAAREGTEMGLKAKSFMDQGALVPDDVIIGLIKEKFSEADFPANWIMDGFPRTLAQAEALDQLLAEIDLGLTVVLNIDVPLDLLMDRLTLRRTCRKTGKIFNLKFSPPDDPEKYDLYQRDDDKPESVQNRLKVYQDQTQPLIAYYEKTGKLVNIHGEQDVALVTEEILKAIEAHR
ncbi:adenylate kinase [bacterium (Candidatus Blackallbacteria) CG17_big_fil_post_rev_8_21_14_2_50_48_46]|uniref:Adenylate kinase n=1 Tax=bacterium (Candidatus Blackallbacteria) CG17_big_fil_post_rev_8_21_14_2_50_48_46 TaxID=2014261 RepID=A0A2M7G289_9BACT|nr:MAG: adenylate kinase [bacterium (Candidatus Blackallbacteria) CG18_big_fil_WC_8_21_14_2_50_49_26]PIW15460.1 MAG: adenylate kinase [bacterium (Candidatus Blackallbacteria) CG17_big_fil_post_rev_8_21_14_2_50_48_46]PIW49813.1 MAG: adenylate kinase [bacterium (Candidatus Blackallbacteria) CG13_big_fil_rev_8_21_14_2_50_49_14]